VPAVRQGAAAARELLIDFACKRWNVQRDEVHVRDGKALHTPSKRTLAYSDLAASEEAAEAFERAIPPDIGLAPVSDWHLLGNSQPRPNARDIVTGAHKYPSNITRPGMLYGKILRLPAYGAKLISVDLAPAKALKDVVAVQDEQFVAVAAPTSLLPHQPLYPVALPPNLH